jgi:curved DNA-binding protein
MTVPGILIRGQGKTTGFAMDYYVVLGVPRDADADTIRRAFRSLARRYHPDAGRGSSSDRFRQIVAAYETLNDPTRRERYDRSLGIARPPRPPYVEPLMSRVAAEPLVGRRRASSPERSPYVPHWPTQFDELIDELFQSWQALFSSGARGRRM